MKARKAGASIFALVLVSVVFLLSGFDYSRHSIPLDDISDGGPGKDGISSIDNPPNWGTWKKKHHHTRVLSDQTGFQLSYDRNPYQGYESSSRLMFDVNLKDSKYHPKEKFIGIEFGGKTKAYAFSELSKTRSTVKDVFNKVPIQIYFDHKTQMVIIRNSKNDELPSVIGFWFAW